MLKENIRLCFADLSCGSELDIILKCINLLGPFRYWCVKILNFNLVQATWRMHSLKDGLMLKMYCGQAKINSMNGTITRKLGVLKTMCVAQSATKVLCKHLQLLNHKVAEMRTEQSISNEALKMLWSEVHYHDKFKDKNGAK